MMLAFIYWFEKIRIVTNVYFKLKKRTHLTLYNLEGHTLFYEKYMCVLIMLAFTKSFGKIRIETKYLSK